MGLSDVMMCQSRVKGRLTRTGTDCWTSVRGPCSPALHASERAFFEPQVDAHDAGADGARSFVAVAPGRPGRERRASCRQAFRLRRRPAREAGELHADG